MLGFLLVSNCVNTLLDLALNDLPFKKVSYKKGLILWTMVQANNDIQKKIPKRIRDFYDGDGF